MRRHWFMWEQPRSAVPSRRDNRMRVSLIVACLLAIGNLVAQQSAPAASETSDLVLVAPSHDPLRLSVSELKALPHITVTFHNTHTNANETYSGVRLVDLLAKLGAPVGDALRGKALARYVVATGSDDKRPARSVRNLIGIELRSAP